MDNSYIKRFVFVHIPKCGGTTLFNVFKEAYGRDNVYRDISFKREYDLTFGKMKEVNKSLPLGFINRFVMADRCYPRRFGEWDEKGFNVIIGHFTVKKYECMNWPFITFIRNPIDRAISEYTIWRNRDSNVGKSITDFSSICPNMINWMIGGNLSNFKFIGILERYEESINKLEKLLGVPLNKKVKSNVSKNKYIPTPKEIKNIEMYHQLDMQLYRKACRAL